MHVAELSEGTYTSYGTPLLFPSSETCRCHGASLLPPLDFTVSNKDTDCVSSHCAGEDPGTGPENTKSLC